jgi:hypothetical protein
VYTSCVLRGTFRFFNKVFLTYQKKVFGMICGVETRLLKYLFQRYLVLSV